MEGAESTCDEGVWGLGRGGDPSALDPPLDGINFTVSMSAGI